MNIILWIIFGGLAGWLGSELVNTDLGLVGNIIVGILGAFLGGWIADKVSVRSGAPGVDRPTNIWSFVWAVIGSIVLLVLAGLLF